MRHELRSRLSYANVMATIAVFIALATGGAYASHLVVNSSDVVNESLLSQDVKGTNGTATTAAVNGTLTGADVSGQPAKPSVGQPFIDGSLTGADIKANSLAGADVNESSLVGVNADKLDGHDSTEWKVTDVIDTRGPLPTEGTHISSGGEFLIMASGSGYRASNTPGKMGISVRVDGFPHGTLQTFTNELFSHKAFVSEYGAVKLSAGSHTIRLEALVDASCGTGAESINDYCTTTDPSDFFEVSVIEVPS